VKEPYILTNKPTGILSLDAIQKFDPSTICAKHALSKNGCFDEDEKQSYDDNFCENESINYTKILSFDQDTIGFFIAKFTKK